MSQGSIRSSIAADDNGVRFLVGTPLEYTVPYDEIVDIHALWERCTNGEVVLEIYLDHFSSVNFRFHNTEPGYADVMHALEKHLPGFSRSAAEAVGFWKDHEDIPRVWSRDDPHPTGEENPSPSPPRPDPQLYLWPDDPA